MSNETKVADAVSFAETVISEELKTMVSEMSPIFVRAILENVILKLSEDLPRKITIELEIPEREKVIKAIESRYAGLEELVKIDSSEPIAGGLNISIL